MFSKQKKHAQMMPMMTKDQEQQKMTKRQQAIPKSQKNMLKMLKALGWT
jgi:hypothetical protein